MWRGTLQRTFQQMNVKQLFSRQRGKSGHFWLQGDFNCAWIVSWCTGPSGFTWPKRVFGSFRTDCKYTAFPPRGWSCSVSIAHLTLVFRVFLALMGLLVLKEIWWVPFMLTFNMSPARRWNRKGCRPRPQPTTWPAWGRLEDTDLSPVCNMTFIEVRGHLLIRDGQWSRGVSWECCRIFSWEGPETE